MKKAINERFGWLGSEILSSNIDLDNTNIPESYCKFLQFSNGGTINNASIYTNSEGKIIHETISRFMSYEEFVTNDYLEVKFEFFENDLEALECIKALYKRYSVFCSTDSNALFAFDKSPESFGEVYYLDLDNFPFLGYKIFQNFDEFLDNITIQ